MTEGILKNGETPLVNLEIVCGQLERLLWNKGNFSSVFCFLDFKSGFGLGLLLFTVVDCI